MQEFKGDLPPATVRTTISLVLFAHFFSVFVAIYGGISPGRDGDQNLKERLRGVVAPYSQALNFESTARFYLTHATAEDAEYRIEYLPEGADPTDNRQWKILTVGQPGTERFHRQQRLAEILGGFGDAQNDDGAAILVASLGDALHSQSGTEVAQIRCFRHLLQDQQDVRGASVDRRNPDDRSFFDEVYRAQLKRLRSGKLLVRRVGETGQEAPVTGWAAGGDRAGGATSDSNAPETPSEVEGRQGAVP